MNQITSKTGYAAAQNGPVQLEPLIGQTQTGPSDMATDMPRTTRIETPPSKTKAGGAQAADAEAVGPVPAEGTAKATANAPRRAAFSEADARLLQRALVTGEGALARRSDLVNMHSSVVKLFETLNQGVGEMYVAKAEKDRSALSARIDGLEEAVNRMEGALRIELEPVLRAAMADVVAQQTPVKTSRGRIAWTGLALALAVTAGAVFHAPLTATISNLETQVSAIVAKFR